MGSFRCSVLLGLLTLCSASANASMLDELSSNALVFDQKGAPLVPVRLMESQKKVELSAPSGLHIRVENEKGSVLLKLESAPQETVVFERISGRAQKIEKRTVLETLEGKARGRRNDVRKEWRARGVRVGFEDVGGVYGVGGDIVDTRALWVTSTMGEKEAFSRFKVRAFTQKFTLEPAQIAFRFTSGNKIRSFKSKGRYLVRVRARNANEGVKVARVHHNRGYKTEGFEDRTMRGEVALAADEFGSFAVVSVVPLWAYVSGILPSEMFASAPLEALKAQAVTARGELFSKVGQRHLTGPYLMCSEQHCQVYKGKSAESANTNKAALQTQGQLAFLKGGLVSSKYSACCGGHSEAGHIVWDQAESPALQGVVDGPPGTRVPRDLSREKAVRAFLKLPRSSSYCGLSSFNQKGTAFRWERRFSVADLNKLTRKLGVGTVRGIRIDERGRGGRLRSLVVEGAQKEARVLRELPVRRLFKNLRSGLFVIDEERDAQGNLTGVVFKGAGFGHGSGMCQQGAIGMAEAGNDYRAILKHYYNGALVKKLF